MQGGMGQRNPLMRGGGRMPMGQQLQGLQNYVNANPFQGSTLPPGSPGGLPPDRMGTSTGAGGMGFAGFSGAQPQFQSAGGVPPGMGGIADPSGGYTGSPTMGSSTGGGGVGYQQQTGGQEFQPRMMDTGSMQQPDFGNWLNDYRQRQGDGFTGTRNGQNFINGNLYAAEGLSQGTDPNTPDFAFQNILNQYAPQIQQLSGAQVGNGAANAMNFGANPGDPAHYQFAPLAPDPQQGMGGAFTSALNFGGTPGDPMAGRGANQPPAQNAPFNFQSAFLGGGHQGQSAPQGQMPAGMGDAFTGALNFGGSPGNPMAGRGNAFDFQNAFLGGNRPGLLNPIANNGVNVQGRRTVNLNLLNRPYNGIRR